MPGAAGLEDAWIRSLLGEDGYLAGRDAQAAVCDAQTVPVVTGTMDVNVIDAMTDLVLAAFAHGTPGHPRHPGHRRARRVRGRRDRTGQRPGPARHPRHPRHSRHSGCPGNAIRPGRPRGPDARRPAPGRRCATPTPASPSTSSPGPTGPVSALRIGLLPHPWNTPSLPLDIGYSDSIPAHIRRAVLLRDKHCAWPHCKRPAAWCDVHHLVHQHDGGETAVRNCVLLCQYHHDVCIHRHGWTITLHPDGTTTARGPRGQVLHSDSPPPGHPPPTARTG